MLADNMYYHPNVQVSRGASGYHLAVHREQLNKVQAELTYTSNKCSALSRENDLLREHRLCPPLHAVDDADPIAEQVQRFCMRPCRVAACIVQLETFLDTD